MTGLPEHEPHNSRSSPDPATAEDAGSAKSGAVDLSAGDGAPPHDGPQSAADERFPAPDHRSGETGTPAFSFPPQFREVEPHREPERIPNFGHLGILFVLLIFALICTGLLTQVALAHHLWGVSSRRAAIGNIHYTLGTEGLLYVFTLAGCLLVFPLVWHKGFFAGVQWNGGIAIRLRWRLVQAALACLTLALLSTLVVSEPKNTPIDKVFHAPGAAWWLFAFGITFAPFFEETFFRGFLLPALCTACDWFAEKTMHQPSRPLGAHGHPQWSMGAMVAGSLAASIPFALLHAQQTGWAPVPFVLLVCVSIVLCAIRLSTRSLASSVLVHAVYNFTLFSIMMVGTQGFRHLGKF